MYAYVYNIVGWWIYLLWAHGGNCKLERLGRIPLQGHKNPKVVLFLCKKSFVNKGSPEGILTQIRGCMILEGEWLQGRDKYNEFDMTNSWNLES